MSADAVKGGNVAVLNYNIRSMRKNFDLFVAKLEDYHEICVTPDIIVLTETWIYDHETHLYTINGYSAFYRCCNSERAGGVAVFVRSDLLRFTMIDIPYMRDDCEFLALDMCITHTNEHFVLVALYRSPSKCLTSFNEHLEQLLTQVNRSTNFLLCGDINVDIYRGNSASFDRNSQRYLDIVSSNGLINVCNKITRKLSNTEIDHFFLRCSSRYMDVSDCSVFDFDDLTDHCAVYFLTPFGAPRETTATNRTYKTTNWTLLDQKMFSTDWVSLAAEAGDDPSSTLKAIICAAMKHLESCTITRKLPNMLVRLKPWMTTGILVAIRQRDKLKKKSDDLSQQIFRLYRVRIQHLILRAKELYLVEQVNRCNGNNAKMWKTLKQHIHGDQAFRINNFSSFNKPDGAIAEQLNSYFVGIGELLAEDIPYHGTDELLPQYDVRNPFQFSPISTGAIIKILSTLQTKKATGPDGLSNAFLKRYRDVLSPVLSIVFNACCNLGVFPETLKIASVVPIHKSGDLQNPANYRPISLLTGIAKLFEQLLAAQLTKYLDEENILHPSQFGFRKNVGTENALVKVVTTVLEALNDRKKVASVFLDLRKAFDTVCHSRLISKLSRIGLTGRSLDILRDYLSNRRQFTRINLANSSTSMISWGVPQGSVLGPLLFIIYVNDIFHLNLKGDLTMYADDTALTCCAKDDLVLELETNEDMKKIRHWLECNYLSLNATKTEIVKYSGSSFVTPISVKVHKQDCLSDLACECPQLSCVKSAKYLGMIVDYMLSWKPHVTSLWHKLLKANATLYKLRNHSEKTLKAVYYAFVQSQIQYGISCYGGTYQSTLLPIINIQKKIIRRVAHADYLDSSGPLFRRLNILSFQRLYMFRLGIFQYKSKFFQLLTTESVYETRRASVGMVNSPQQNFTFYQKSLCVHIIWLYNKYITVFRSSPSFLVFKETLKNRLSNDVLDIQ
jgi:hypothetical protein